jgi:uncharacterized protein (TIGR04141 family)
MKTVAKNKEKCFLMHKKIIQYGGGHSSIEFCDLIINKKDFVHIKRFRGSSALSHMYQQGLISATIFLQDIEFHRELNKLLPVNMHFPIIKSLKASKYEIVFAIVSKVLGDIKELLPFFSKISLLQTYTQLRAYGYQVSMAIINTDDNIEN